MRRHAPFVRLSSDVLTRLEDAEGDEGLTLLLGPDGDEINLDREETRNLAALLNDGFGRPKTRGPRRVKCPHCPKTAKTQRGLLVHIGRAHKDKVGP